MAIKLAHIDKTANKVTFSVSGIPSNHDRQGYIWVPHPIVSGGDWVTLGMALALGYIARLTTNPNDNNSDISVTFNTTHLSDFPVWIFQVVALQGSTIVDFSDLLYTTTSFNWDTVKAAEAQCRTGWSEFHRVNYVCASIGAWIGANAYGSTAPDLGYSYAIDSTWIGDNVYYDYLRICTYNLYHTIDAIPAARMEWYGGDRDYWRSLLSTDLNDIKSKGNVYASFFNNISLCINGLYLNV